MEDYVEIYWKAWRSRLHHRCRLSEIRDIKSHRVCPRKDSAPSRACHRKTFAVRRKQRKEDGVTRRQSLITRETNPARQSRRMKKRESRDKSRATATRQPLSHFLPTRCFSLSVCLTWRRCCCFCSRWLIASCDVKINGPRCAKQTIRVPLPYFFFFYCVSSLERNRFRGTAESAALNRVNSITPCLRVAQKACDKTSRYVTFRITNILYTWMAQNFKAEQYFIF